MKHDVFGYVVDNDNGRLTVERQLVSGVVTDYGYDPIWDEAGEPTGMVRLVPSGRVVPSGSSEARRAGNGGRAP